MLVHTYLYRYFFNIYMEESLGVMAKVMDCGIIVRDFKLQSCYYVHLQTNTLGKDMNPFILPAMG